MTRKQYQFCVAEACSTSDRDAYVSDVALSSIWNDPPKEVDIPQERISMLIDIWDACNIGFKDIAKATGMSARAMAESLCIPYRTIEQWCSGIRQCPIYVKLMIQQVLGIYDPPIKINNRQ